MSTLSELSLSALGSTMCTVSKLLPMVFGVASAYESLENRRIEVSFILLQVPRYDSKSSSYVSVVMYSPAGFASFYVDKLSLKVSFSLSVDCKDGRFSRSKLKFASSCS